MIIVENWQIHITKSKREMIMLSVLIAKLKAKKMVNKMNHQYNLVADAQDAEFFYNIESEIFVVSEDFPSIEWVVIRDLMKNLENDGYLKIMQTTRPKIGLSSKIMFINMNEEKITQLRELYPDDEPFEPEIESIKTRENYYNNFYGVRSSTPQEEKKYTALEFTKLVCSHFVAQRLDKIIAPLAEAFLNKGSNYLARKDYIFNQINKLVADINNGGAKPPKDIITHIRRMMQLYETTIGKFEDNKVENLFKKILQD